MRYREPFCVFPKRLESGRVVYYYQTYDPQGKRTNPKSTGAVKRHDARMYCMRLFQEGRLGIPDKRVPTFAEYSIGWWDPKTCEYLKSRMIRRKISASYGRQARRNLDRHILPAFGKTKIDEITAHEIDVWMVSKLRGGLSANSVNLMFAILKVMLDHAAKKGLIDKNPCASVQRAALTKRKIEILTAEEVKKLFTPDDLEYLWGQELQYTLNMVAATTGMRIGEILGLKGTAVRDGYLEVSAQFNGDREYTDTKTHETRYVTIPGVVARGLLRLKAFNGDGYLFSTDGGEKPISRAAIYKHLHSALARIGIDRNEQRRRGLTFHKWRHFFNTTLRMGNVADSKVRELTGHKSEAMTEHYTHFDPRTFGDVKRIQEGIALGALEERSPAASEEEVASSV